jgi:hypothetical protein
MTLSRLALDLDPLTFIFQIAGITGAYHNA